MTAKTRYDQLLELIDEHKPKSIVEIGVWNGANAIRMIKRALRYNTKITYTGYDLFEEATPRTDTEEFNVKGHNRERAVAAYIKAETGIVPVLVKGNTRNTLVPTFADFVFLDGGHSIATIASDYERVRNSKVVVLDDYYTSDGVGCPDTAKYGCNKLVSSLAIPFDILTVKDPIKGGGFTQLVVVINGR
jgi:predicted O-methyltransferase YrrM